MAAAERTQKLPAGVLDPKNITIEQTFYGPIQRITLASPFHYPQACIQAQLSIHRVGEILIDTGCRRYSAALLQALSDTLPACVLLTHQHEDHVGGLAALCRARPDLSILAPDGHLELIRNPPAPPDYRLAVWGQPEPVDGLLPLQPGDLFRTGSIVVETVATPGHTPGHVSFLVRDGEGVYLIGGDLFISIEPLMTSETAADDMAASQRRVAALSEELQLLPTHGSVRKKGAATLRKAAAWIEAEAELVRETAWKLGTDNCWIVAAELYGPDDLAADVSGGDLSQAAWVRSVLSPVRSLPAPPLPPRPAEIQ